MSLKAFHIVFVTASILLALLVAWWCFNEYQSGAGSAYLLGSLASVAGAIGMGIYGRWFLEKLKGVSTL